LQSGNGFKDVIKSGYNFIKNGVKRVKDVLTGVRKGASPSVRAWLEKYGDEEVVEMKICRKPIFSVIEKLANALSNNQLDRNKDQLNYDRLMHLFILIELYPRDSGGSRVYKIEKNHVVEIQKARWDTDSKTEEMRFNVNSAFRMNTSILSAERTVGIQRFWIYDPRTANCQLFVKWLLQHTSGWNNQIETFVMQDADAILQGMGLLARAGRVLTDIANVGDVALNGAGKRR